MAALLDTIVAHKSAELRRDEARLPRAQLLSLLEGLPKPRPFAAALAGAGPRIIAEVKRASPRAGVLRTDRPWDAEALARTYESSGAAALSVLTDTRFFWGSADTLAACRDVTALPALRKDFLLSPYHVEQSRLLGADAVLLIVRILTVDVLLACARRARELSMAVLVEVHADAELERARPVLELGPEVILGVNHRDLDTMQMDMERALRLRDRVAAGQTLVAESGIDSRQVIERFAAAGIDAFLIGEHLAAADDPGGALRALRGS